MAAIVTSPEARQRARRACLDHRAPRLAAA
jgi:hypothetical protein